MIELKEVTENDADFLFELYQSRESFNLIEPIKYEDQQSFVNSYIQKQDSHPYQIWNVIWKDDKRIGSATLQKRENAFGIWLIPEFQQGGYGSEALKEFLKKYPLEYYTCIINIRNVSSLHLLQKYGFRIDGIKFYKKGLSKNK